MPLLPQEPHHSLFFTNAPCCQPDWPLCAGFANKFRLRFSSDTRRILTQRIVATLINDVKINRVPALSENALFQLARSLVVVSNGTWSEENDRGYGKEKGKRKEDTYKRTREATTGSRLNSNEASRIGASIGRAKPSAS